MVWRGSLEQILEKVAGICIVQKTTHISYQLQEDGLKEKQVKPLTDDIVLWSHFTHSPQGVRGESVLSTQQEEFIKDPLAANYDQQPS